MMLASLAITIFLAFSASAVQSESTTEKPPPMPSKIRHPPPPPSKSHHPPPPPPPRPRKHHQPPPPDEKAAKSTTGKSKRLKAGKTVGLVFCGVAAMLQIGAVGYLTYKRNQLYQVPD